MITILFNGILSIVSWVVSWVFSLIDTILPIFPDLTIYSDEINLFWDKIFSIFGHFRSIFLIDSHHLKLIVLILTIKFTYKPTIYLIKIIIKWFKALKL